jgi:hypothetical protein
MSEQPEHLSKLMQHISECWPDADPQNVLALAQQISELAPETASFEEFSEMLGMPVTCNRCGRTGLDWENETDCTLVDADDPQDDFDFVLVCHECLNGPPPPAPPQP